MTNTVSSELAVVGEFLDAFVQKNAGSIDKDTAEVDDLAKPDVVSDAQGAEGAENTERAKETGSTVGEITNTEEKAVEHTDDAAPKKMTVDDTVAAASDVVKKVVQLDQNMEQKAARRDQLRKGLAELIEAEMQKEAAASENATEEDEALQKVAAEAAEYAQGEYEGYILGRLQRIEDEAILKEAGLTDEQLGAFGGISGVLDKLAEVAPEIVLPDGAAIPEGDAAMDVPAAAGVDAGVDPGAESDLSPEDAEALQQMMTESGVTEEDMAAAAEVVGSLLDEGETPESILEALEQEMSGEAGAAPDEAAAATVDAAAAPADVIPPEIAPDVDPTAVEEKVASDRDAMFETLRQNLKGRLEKTATVDTKADRASVLRDALSRLGTK